MRVVIIIVILCAFIQPAHSQKPFSKFGEVTLPEMAVTAHGPDSLAAALILFDKGETILREDLSVTFTRHVRLKILSKEGLDWGDYSVYLDRSNQTIGRLKGNTFNLENGMIVTTKMEDASIFKSKFSKYEDQVKFTLPNMREGSIIEYSYQIRTTTGLLSPWQFQYSIPVLYSEYTVSIPTVFNFRKDLQGYLAVNQHEEKGASEKFVMLNIPAFKKEPYTSTEDDYLSKISFYISELILPGMPTQRLTKSWEEIVKAVNEDEDFGGMINGSGYLKKVVEEVIIGAADDQKKIAAIYSFVKGSVEWDETMDRYPDHTFKQVLEKKKGSSSEINLLLVSMLRKAGLIANPVFISTRDNGKVRPFLTQPGQFNDVICLVKVKGKAVLLDGTDRDLPMTALPKRCLNGAGLVISPAGPEWTEITCSRSKEVVDADLTIGEDGALNGKITKTSFGIAGGEIRKAYKKNGEESYLKDMVDGKNWEIAKSEFRNLEAGAESISETHNLVIRDHAQINGPMAYINPFVMGRNEENPLKSKERLYPVDFTTPFEKVYMLKIQVPENYMVEELPKSKATVLPDNAGRFLYNIGQTGNSITLTSMFIINKNVFTQQEYGVLREFYDQVVAKQNEQIVLKKK